MLACPFPPVNHIYAAARRNAAKITTAIIATNRNEPDRLKFVPLAVLQGAVSPDSRLSIVCMSFTLKLLELHKKGGEVHQRNANHHTAEIDPVDERQTQLAAVARDQFAYFPDHLQNRAYTNGEEDRR